MKYLCFDIGGTDIKYGIVDDQGNLLECSKDKRKYKIDEFEDQLISICNKYPEYNTVIVTMHGYKGDDSSFKFYNPKDKIEGIGKNVYMVNESVGDAYSEFYCGNLKGVNSGLVLSLGTGIATGLIYEGKIIDFEESYYIPDQFAPLINKYQNIYECSCEATISRCQVIDESIIDGPTMMEKIDNPKIKEIIVNQTKAIANIINDLSKDIKLDKIVIDGGITNNQKYCELLLNNKFDIPVDIGKYKGFSAMVGGCIKYVYKTR